MHFAESAATSDSSLLKASIGIKKKNKYLVTVWKKSSLKLRRSDVVVMSCSRYYVKSGGGHFRAFTITRNSGQCSPAVLALS